MDDNFFLKIQIADNCRLALPNGLKELMSDISREVRQEKFRDCTVPFALEGSPIRAQPQNLYGFITKYLAALLVTRENLNTAAHICDDICENLCAADLDDELRYKGFDEEHIDQIKEIVNDYMLKVGTGIPIKEGDLLTKIMMKTRLSVDQVQNVQEAVRRAFQRHLANTTTIYQQTPVSSMDSIDRAVHHTLDLFRKSKPTEVDYERAATRIAAAYRAYRVRRAMKQADKGDTIRFKLDADWKSDTSIDPVEGNKQSVRNLDALLSNATVSVKTGDDIYVHSLKPVITVSSTSLAGSLVNMPAYKPYTAFENLKEHAEENLSTTTETYVKDTNAENYRESVEEKVIEYNPIDDTPGDVDSAVEDAEAIHNTRKVKSITIGDVNVTAYSDTDLEYDHYDEVEEHMEFQRIPNNSVADMDVADIDDIPQDFDERSFDHVVQ